MGNIHKDKSHEEQFEKDEAQDRENAKLSEEDIEDVLRTQRMLNGMLGKLCEIITSGETGDESNEKKSEKVTNFFAWLTPGQPVTAEQFDFASSGIGSPVLTKEDTKELEKRVLFELKNNPEGDRDTIIENLKNEFLLEKQNANQLSAYEFAHMVDFVPDVSGKGNDKLRTLYDKGGVVEVYKRILDFSQVKKGSLTEEETKNIERFRELLADRMKENIVTKEMEPDPGSNPIMAAYNEYASRYNDAAQEYNNLRVNAMKDPTENLRWVYNGPILKNKVQAAMKDWIIKGYKNDYEQIAAYIDQVQARDLTLLKDQYKNEFKEYEREAPSTGSFYYTTFAPANFARSTGWTKFSFKSTESSEYDRTDKSSESTEWGGGTNIGKFFSASVKHNDSEKSVDILTKIKYRNFTCSFEVAQVSIIRPWLKESFLNSKYWRFSEKDTTECISDGKVPPDGLMPAYPTSIIFIRNVEIAFDSGVDFKSIWEKELKSATEAGSKLKIFFFSADAHYKKENEDSVDGKATYHINKEGNLCIPGMQIIGYNCHILGKTPNPADEEGIEWV
ncbi:MAG: hypothetical protein SOY65_07500 [Marinifilaceae bacterium]|nr:hypothetical protein [Marinifilaceae bacterium]